MVYSIEKVGWLLPGRLMRDILIGIEDIIQIFVPLIAKSGSMFMQTRLQGAVESFNHAIALKVVSSRV